MAFKFRHDPPPFKLTRNLLDDVASNTKTELTRYLFGYSVTFTADKRKKLVELGVVSHSFDTFVDSFNAFIAQAPFGEIDSAKRDFGKKRRIDVYARVGVYDKHGNFVRSFEDEAKLNPSFKRAGQAHVCEDGAGSNQREKSFADFAKEATAAFSGRGKERTFSDATYNSFSNDDKTNAAAEMDERKAEKTAKAAEDLEKKVLETRFSPKFELSKIQRPADFEEKHVPVARGSYGGVRRSIVSGKPGGFVITGPTGCGKSTVALLPLFLGKKSVLVVEPTQANAANIFHEFANVLPNLYHAGVINLPIPEVCFVAPTVSKPPFKQLMVTTTEKLLEYFHFTGKLPKCDYLVLDEFHLPIPSMVECVELLRTFEVVSKYILVSATAVGYSVNPQLPKAVTHIYGNLQVGTLPEKLEHTDVDPRRWSHYGDGTVAVVMPSVLMAERLHDVYLSWGVKSHLITRNTVVSEYLAAASNYKPCSVFVLEPGVEAGVTLSMSVLISLGATSAVRYDGHVVVEDTQPLDAIAAIQRGGRGGRVRPTLYLTPKAPGTVSAASSADYYRAQAVVKMVGMGANLKNFNDRGLFEVFPRLRTVTRQLAVSAMQSGGDPFVAIYKRDDNGRVYRECGGDGEGFARLAEKELYLYYYGTGFFVAPIVDFSDLSSQPDTFVVRRQQLSAATTMVKTIEGLWEKYTLDDLIGMLVGKFDIYVSDMFDTLAVVFDQPKAVEFGLGSESRRAPEIADFLSGAPAVVKLFEYMMTQPAGVTYDRKVSDNGKFKASHSFSHKGKNLHFAFAEQYMNGNTLNVPKLCDAVYNQLRDILALEVLLDGAPGKCVDLRTYVGRVPPEHIWFKTKCLGS